MCDPIGNLSKINTLEELLNGEKMIAMRRGLLSGEPEPCCRTCPAMPWTTTAALKERVASFLTDPVRATEHSQRRQEYFELGYDPLLYQREYENLRVRYDELAQEYKARSLRNIWRLSRLKKYLPWRRGENESRIKKRMGQVPDEWLSSE
jgi:hypothetical protein